MTSAAPKTTNELTVSDAVDRDICSISKLCRIWCDESGYYDLNTLDSEKISKLMGYFIQGNGHVVVTKAEGQVIGFVAGATLERLFSKELITQIVAAYLLPKYQHTAAMDLMVWRLQAQAIELGSIAVEVPISIMEESVHLERAVRRSGFLPIAAHFGWSSKAVQGAASLAKAN